VLAAAQVMLTPEEVDIFSFTHIMVMIPCEAAWGGAAVSL